jgi:hypothetical protein
MRPALALLGLLLVPTLVLAKADARLNFLIKRLEKASDSRGRAQAALMLGASGEAVAIPALCNALSDDEDVVRSAAAKALKEIGESEAVDCLKRALGSARGESRSAIQQALDSFQKQASRQAELYVHLVAIQDLRDSPESSSAKDAEKKLRARLAKMGVVLAPADENPKQARSVLKTKKLRGYQLMPKLYSLPNGGLRLTLVGLTYPDRALLGEVSLKASGGQPADLLGALVPAALEEAAKTFDWGASP